MKRIIIAVLSLFAVMANAALAHDDDVTDPQTIIELITEHTRLQNVMFMKGSNKADVDNVYALYTADYIYNHPGQGDIYSRELLYGNTVRYVEQGGYDGDGSEDKKVTKIIVGKNAATFEWIYINEPETTYMTLAEFSGGKFSMMKEYW